MQQRSCKLQLKTQGKLKKKKTTRWENMFSYFHNKLKYWNSKKKQKHKTWNSATKLTKLFARVGPKKLADLS